MYDSSHSEEDDGHFTDSSSEHDDSSDDDYKEKEPSKRKIDAKSRAKAPQLVRTGSGASEYTFTTTNGLNAFSRKKGNKVETTVSGMKKLPAGERAPTEPSKGHIKLKTDKKGKNGGRKYNPNDQASTHIGGQAGWGVPGTHGMTLDASHDYNNQHLQGHEKKLKGKSANLSWDVKSTAELEAVDDPDRIKEIMSQQKRLHPEVTKERVAKRMKKARRKSTELKSIKSFQTTLTSGKQKIEGDYGRDVDHMMKAKWLDKKSGYDPDDSSSDEDIEKGTVV